MTTSSGESVNFQVTWNATIAVTSTSASVEMEGGGTSFMFQNAGSQECFVLGGPSNVVAVAGGAITASPDGSTAIQPGAIMVLSIPSLPAVPYIAAVCASGNSTLLRISQGTGS